MSGTEIAQRLIQGGALDPLRLHKAAVRLTSPTAIDEFYAGLDKLTDAQQALVKTGIAVYLPRE